MQILDKIKSQPKLCIYMAICACAGAVIAIISSDISWLLLGTFFAILPTAFSLYYEFLFESINGLNENNNIFNYIIKAYRFISILIITIGFLQLELYLIMIGFISLFIPELVPFIIFAYKEIKQNLK